MLRPQSIWRAISFVFPSTMSKTRPPSRAVAKDLARAQRIRQVSAASLDRGGQSDARSNRSRRFGAHHPPPRVGPLPTAQRQNWEDHPHGWVMNTPTPIRRGLGIPAGLDPGLARDLAARCVDLGYHSLWSNDEPTAPGLDTLAQFAAAAPRIELGVGVLPLDRYPPGRIAAEIARLELDPAKLWVGVGSGQLTSPTARVRAAVTELRRLLPEDTRLVVAAMRPQMCRTGGAVADAVLLNWMLPAHAAAARRWVQEGAEQAGRAAPLTSAYVRVAVGPNSLQRLRDEESRYRTINQAHRRHFDAMNVPLGSVGVAAAARPELLEALAPYHTALDLPIARLLAEHDATSLIAAAIAAAP